MASITQDARTKLARQTDRALSAATTALGFGPGMALGRWRGRGDYASLGPEARREAALDALEGLAAATVAVQAAHDALSAELVEAGVLPEAREPSAAYPDATWQVLETEGHWATSSAALARLVASDVAADLSDAARMAVPVSAERRSSGALVERAAGCVGLAAELLDAAVIAEHEDGMAWARIDEVLSGSLSRWDGLGRSAEGRWGAAVARWHRGLDEPMHYPTRPGGLGSRSLPDAAIHPRSTARRLDAWVIARRQPADYRGEGDSPVSAGTVDAEPDDLLSASSRSSRLMREETPVRKRVFWERKAAAAEAVTGMRSGDERTAAMLADARAQLATVREGQGAAEVTG